MKREGKPRQEPPPRFLQLQTSAAPAATRSPVHPLPSQFAPKGTLMHAFISPFHVGSERMRFYPRFSLFKVSAPFPVLLVDTVFYSAGCTVGRFINIPIQYNTIVKYYIKLIKINILYLYIIYHVYIYHFNL